MLYLQCTALTHRPLRCLCNPTVAEFLFFGFLLGLLCPWFQEPLDSSGLSVFCLVP